MSAAVDAAAAEVVDAFRRCGIESMLLRGPAIAQTLYDDPFDREYSDVDLLVQVPDFPRAARALSDLGYREAPIEKAFPTERPGHATTWLRGDGRAVDLHRSLVGITADPLRVWPVFRDEARSLRVGGVDAPIPSPAVTALVVALHASHHGARGAHPSRDLSLARAKLPPEVWHRAEQIAEELGATPAFAAALGRRPAERGRPADELRGGRAFHVAQGLVWLRASPGTGAKLRLLRELLFPAAATMRQRSELARRGGGWLALVYVARVLDGARYLPRALHRVYRSSSAGRRRR